MIYKNGDMDELNRTTSSTGYASMCLNRRSINEKAVKTENEQCVQRVGNFHDMVRIR